MAKTLKMSYDDAEVIKKTSTALKVILKRIKTLCRKVLTAATAQTISLNQ